MTQDEAIARWQRLPALNREEIIASCALSADKMIDIAARVERDGLALLCEAAAAESAAWYVTRELLRKLHEEASAP